jgi:glycosyltransferase involved in cell wall biosynthesis
MKDLFLYCSMNILFLTRYGAQGASSRMRLYQYFSFFDSASIEFTVSPLLDDAALLKKYNNGRYGLMCLARSFFKRFCLLLQAKKFDFIWIEKEALPWFPVWIEKVFLRHVIYVMDFDDAIFHNYDMHPNWIIRYFFKDRIDSLIRNAALVVAGNEYLMQRSVSAGANRVVMIPTVIDLNRYSEKVVSSNAGQILIVWIGSPSTFRYLVDLKEVFIQVASKYPIALRIIGAGTIEIPGVQVQAMPWSLENEALLIRECDIGIMPLHNSPWELGKCAYKLIQYMACGLPTVASPVGSNLKVVIEGESGFFAETTSDWISKIELLCSSPTLRQRLGKTGRARVEAEYCVQMIAPRLLHLFASVGGQ